jgi:hypothetical protein
MASMLRLVPLADWHRITGPAWMTKEAFDALSPNSRAKHPEYPILIDGEFVLRASVT